MQTVSTRRAMQLQRHVIPVIMTGMTEHLGTEVADRVRGIAAQKRVRQEDLARALGSSRMAIVRRFNGSVPFTDRELVTLARVLGVPVGAFFGEVAA